jgi:Sec7 domain
LLNNKLHFFSLFPSLLHRRRPQKGIEYLYENHLLKIDAQDVAQFLYKGEGLNKTAIGE